MTFAPQTQDEAVDIIRVSAAHKRSLKIVGGGTRQALGRDIAADDELNVSGLSGITLYEPAELVMSARVGTPLALIEQELHSRGQFMAFEPPDYRGLLGSEGVPTIGGVFATNASGPRRVASGAARDHLLGVTLINGRSQLIRAGGRVMKNVTGLDLTKLVCGAYGTLGLMTEVTFKVLPQPRFEQTLVVPTESIVHAIALMTRALGSAFEVSGAAFCNNSVLLRLEGFIESVRYRTGALAGFLKIEGQTIEAQESAQAWQAIKSVGALKAQQDAEIWRLSVAPSKAAGLLGLLPEDCNVLLDWSAGLIWVASEAPIEHAMRPAVGEVGGHLMLFRARADRRQAVSPFHPLTNGTRRLTQGLKASMDPSGIFNPGKMYKDI
ncbi:glycolate oxidase subunit GlcE [Devosia sp. ZW T5_3]|uniref:glycolate oxidase subunit GlcE n=1 Tax=Devosia sp. ZW T5_3 TaxID=3378085 RepID=UPI0038545F52